MEGRCAVETLAEFGFSGSLDSLRLISGSGADVFICNHDLYVFNSQDRKLTAVLQFPVPVIDVVENKQLLYVASSCGVYAVNLKDLQQRAPGSSVDDSSGPAELKISSEFLIIGADGVCSLLLVGSVLLTLGQRDGSWLLTLYKTPNQVQSSSYEMLGTFSLPLVSAAVSGDSHSASRRRTVMICIYCGGATRPSSSHPSSQETSSHRSFHLDPVLFKLLFGVEAALANSPVILFGLPDGRLCFLPLRLPGSRLGVLTSLEQPLVFVGASVVAETDSRLAQCLVAVGEGGKVVLMKADKGAAEDGGLQAAFTEGFVSGSVTCGCVDKSFLYYSTGSDLLAIDLSKGSSWREGKERDEETANKTSAALQTPTSFNVCRVGSLAEPTRTAAGEVQLLGLSVTGRLQRIGLPMRPEDAGLSTLNSARRGLVVRDLLSAVGDVCKRASALNKVIKSKNQMLRHLNHVVNISFLMIDCPNMEDPGSSKEKPIRCWATANWSRLFLKDTLNLTCVLENSSSYTLEGGWTLSVTVYPLSYPVSAGGESPSTNFLFPIHHLSPGETFEVSLPLTDARDASFPTTVNCSLVYSLSGLLGVEEAATILGSQNGLVSVPLNMLTVDWLHALQVNSPTTNQKMATSLSSSTTNTIQDFLNSRQVKYSKKPDRGGESALTSETYSARVQIGADLLKETPVLKSSNLTTENLCVCLLDWLLSDGGRQVKVCHQREKIVLKSPVVHARGPNGAAVKLAAREVNPGEESRGKVELPTIIEVQVESQSVAAVCGLHHAVLRRMQTLLQKSSEKTASTNTQMLGLRRALQRAEIQQSQISGAFGAGASRGQINRHLLSVYRELRENPLLII